jgi:hypothetical protein
VQSRIWSVKDRSFSLCEGISYLCDKMSWNCPCNCPASHLLTVGTQCLDRMLRKQNRSSLSCCSLPVEVSKYLFLTLSTHFSRTALLSEGPGRFERSVCCRLLTG